MIKHRDIKGKAVSILWDSDKSKALTELYSSHNKKDICILLGVNQRFLNRKIRELKLDTTESFSSKFKICTKCKQSLPKNKEYFGTNKIGNSVVFRSACKTCSKNVQIVNSSELNRYLKEIIRSKKYDTRKCASNFNIDTDYLLDLYNSQEGKCNITGIQMTHSRGTGFNLTNISVDRIDPNGGYTKDNIQLVCLWANVSKNSLNMEEFKNFILLANNKLNG